MVYVPFNSHFHIETGPEHYHLCGSQTHIKMAACDLMLNLLTTRPLRYLKDKHIYITILYIITHMPSSFRYCFANSNHKLRPLVCVFVKEEHPQMSIPQSYSILTHTCGSVKSQFLSWSCSLYCRGVFFSLILYSCLR